MISRSWFMIRIFAITWMNLSKIFFKLYLRTFLVSTIVTFVIFGYAYLDAK